LELFKTLKSSKDVFLDADLKFNGSLPEFTNITFFVKEENFFAKLDHLQKSTNKITFCTNRNTSIFSWGKACLDFKQLSILDELYENLEEFLVPGDRYNQYVGHLREQIAMSILVQLLEKDINYLKDSDSQFDGKLVESSYFGATGSLYSALGHKPLRDRTFSYFFGKSKNS
jgi:hypothetical protein